MMLKITRDYDRSKDLNTESTILKYTMLAEKGTHLFIASNHWDSVYVELHPDLKPEHLHFLSAVSDNITVYCDGNLSDYMNCLVELYPQKSGAIRKAVMQKQDLAAVLGECVLCKAL